MTCPVRESAHTKAAKEFYGMKVQMFDKPPFHIRALDWIGNLPHRFGRWVDRSAAMQTLCLSIGAVIACALAALVVMR